jgi:integrase
LRIGRVRPKTPAGRRSIAIPSNVWPALEYHLEHQVDADPTRGCSPVRAMNRSVLARWTGYGSGPGKRSAVRNLHIHDLRHSGLTWAATTGATVAELMHRAGHSSPAAALRYQHATQDRDRAIADALASLAVIVPRDGRGIDVAAGSNP